MLGYYRRNGIKICGKPAGAVRFSECNPVRLHACVVWRCVAQSVQRYNSVEHLSARAWLIGHDILGRQTPVHLQTARCLFTEKC